MIYVICKTDHLSSENLCWIMYSQVRDIINSNIFTLRSTLFSQALPVPCDEEIRELSEVDQPPIIQLAASIWFGVLAHSSFLCYFMVFLYQIMHASVLSTPLPLMVFLWGSLTIPRPSKTFWVTLIAYIEVRNTSCNRCLNMTYYKQRLKNCHFQAVVIMKCIFQLELIPWNQIAPRNHPLFVPRILGIQQKANYALWDLLLLLILFFHRYKHEFTRKKQA